MRQHNITLKMVYKNQNVWDWLIIHIKINTSSKYLVFFMFTYWEREKTKLVTKFRDYYTLNFNVLVAREMIGINVNRRSDIELDWIKQLVTIKIKNEGSKCVVYEFDYISTLYRLFEAEIWLICKCLILIIKSRYQHRCPWPSPTTLLYRPLLLVGLRGYILYRHRAVVCRFKLVVLPLLVHVRGPQEYVTTSPAVSHMSGLSNLDSFWDGW